MATDPATVEAPGPQSEQDSNELAQAPREVKFYRPKLYREQEAAIYDPARISIIEASTKTGKTSGCICWLLEKAYLGKPGHQFWWVAPTLGVSKIAYRRMKRALPQDSFKANESECSITLADISSTIVFKGADRPDTLYGEDVRAAVIDEASRTKPEAWHAVRSTLTATLGPIRIIGNKRGRRNWAYQLARKAEAGGDKQMKYHRLTAQMAIAAGIFPQEEYDDAKRVLPPAIFAQLYDCVDGDDEGNPFGLAAIAACVNKNGLSTRAAVAFGWDLAKSVDFTVGTGLDEAGAVAAWDRWQHCPWPETEAKIIRQTNGAQAFVDSTGAGDPILEHLQQNPAGGANFEGWVFTNASKQQLMEGLAADLQARRCSYPDGAIVLELESFEYSYSFKGRKVLYSAPEGFNDDCVCSLALARARQRNNVALGVTAMNRDELLSADRGEMGHGRFLRGRGMGLI
jgi:hypothetical protein